MALQDAVYDQLVSVRTGKAEQIENFFKEIDNQIQLFAADDTFITAMVRFNTSFKELQQIHIPTSWEREIEQYYSTDFMPKLYERLEGVADFNLYRLRSQAAVYLQYYYIINNPNDTVSHHQLDDAGDGSEYTRWHVRYHPGMRDLVNRFGYDNLYLINLSGQIVYSVHKDVALGTSLLDGPYRSSSLAGLIRTIQASPDRGLLRTADFMPFRPDYAEPRAFFAIPLFNGTHLIGILAFGLPVDRINNIMTSNQSWEQMGFGQTGETYLVGADLLMRSDSRFLLEDPDAYLQSLSRNGVTRENVNAIRTSSSSILLEQVNSDTVVDALAGLEGIRTTTDYRNRPVISAFQPVNIQGLEWALLAEMDVSEAFAPIAGLERDFAMAATILIVLITLFAILIGRLLLVPISRLMVDAQNVAMGEQEHIEFRNRKDEFGKLGEALNDVVHNIRAQAEEIKEENRILTNVLGTLLPRQVSRRLRAGDESFVDSVAQTSVLVAHFEGLSEFLSHGDVDQTSEFFDELLDAIDDAGNRLGVEKIRFGGNSYVAVSGLHRARLDHAIRLAGFTHKVQELMAQFNNDHQVRLTLKAGIDTGSIHFGILGKRQVSYDVWGVTADVANQLSIHAKDNEVLVTQAVYDQLSEHFDFEGPLQSYGQADSSPEGQTDSGIGNEIHNVWRLTGSSVDESLLIDEEDEEDAGTDARQSIRSSDLAQNPEDQEIVQNV
ncbi:MAG: adenylate/guanylate cyclase domain-containing protein [Chloroflexota bacterium]